MAVFLLENVLELMASFIVFSSFIELFQSLRQRLGKILNKAFSDLIGVGQLLLEILACNLHAFFFLLGPILLLLLRTIISTINLIIYMTVVILIQQLLLFVNHFLRLSGFVVVFVFEIDDIEFSWIVYSFFGVLRRQDDVPFLEVFSTQLFAIDDIVEISNRGVVFLVFL
jgi:hypothetical protein